MKASYAVALALVAIALGNSSPARADIIASWASGLTGDYTYTGGTSATGSTFNSNGTLTGSLLFGPTFFTPVGPYGVTITVTATSHTAATDGTTPAQGGFSGTVTINNNSGGTVGGVANGGNFLTISFSSATLTNLASGAYSLGGSATITTHLGAPITQPESFSISVTGATNPNGTLGAFGFNNFTANDSGNASATIGVPEPSTIALAGLGALGFVGYAFRRRKAMS
jgi:hypothetical protein